ncbi:MAG: hypothetical protein K6A33_05860 [Clostridiales bacterium]|nr:hypothetical protein [Clostridiales bacterium]
MKKIALIVLVLAAAMLFIAHAAADAPVAPAEVAAEPAAIVSEVGLRRLPVTSAMVEGADAGPVTVLFDGRSEPAMVVDLKDSPDRVFTLTTSSGVPQTLAAFGILTDGAPGAKITLRVFGSNDSLLKEWTPLPLIQSVGEQNGFKMFHLEKTTADWKDVPAYAFYRFEFTADFGDGSEATSYNLREVILLRPESDEPDMVYAIVEAVEPGELPPLVPASAAEEEAPAEAAEPAEEPAPAPKSWNNYKDRVYFGSHICGLGMFH